MSMAALYADMVWVEVFAVLVLCFPMHTGRVFVPFDV